MVSSLSLRAWGSSGCLVKKPPHYLHCARGRHSMSSLRCFSVAARWITPQPFLQNSHLCFYTIEMKITEPLPHQIRSVLTLQPLQQEGEPSLTKRKCFASSMFLVLLFLNTKSKTQIAGVWHFSFFFFSPANGLRYFKCCLSFRGRAALDMAVHRVNNCHPESLTVWSAWLE